MNEQESNAAPAVPEWLAGQVSFVRNPYVLKTGLVERTGCDGVDDWLYLLVNALQLSVGDLLRAIYVVGSWVHGEYPSDEVDCCLLWKGTPDRADHQKAFSLVSHLTRVSKYHIDPMYDGPAGPLYRVGPIGGGYQNGAVLRLGLKEHSLLLWGEDIRPKIVLMDGPDEMLVEVVAAPMNWIRGSFGVGRKEPLRLPLADPAGEEEYRVFGDFGRLCTLVTHVARAWVFVETGEFLFNKLHAADSFADHIGGEWTGVVRDLHDARFVDLTAEQRQDRHRRAAGGVTGLVNAFLEALVAQGVDISTPPS